MMREMLQRRFGRALKEAAEGARPPDWPDLLLIDGGAGQFSAARAMMADLGVNDVKLVAIAKGPDRDAGREWFHTDGRPPSSCRRAIRCSISCSGCATRRTVSPSPPTAPAARKRSGQSELDEIDGHRRGAEAGAAEPFRLGPRGEDGGPEDLEAAPGISRETARRVYAYFHPGVRMEEERKKGQGSALDPPRAERPLEPNT